MPVFKREMAFAPDRPTGNLGDRWHLVLETEAPSLCVKHTWIHASPHRDGQAAHGTQRFGINDFLASVEGRLAHPTLMGTLKEMLRDAACTSE